MGTWAFLLYTQEYSSAPIDKAKFSFYRSANAIGKLVSEDVTLQLIKTKCIPILLYGFEACPVTKRQLSSIDFDINSFYNEIATKQ